MTRGCGRSTRERSWVRKDGLAQPGRDSSLSLHLRVSPPALFSGKKSCVDLHVAVKTTRRAISDVVVLNCESLTRYSHRRFDNNYLQRVAPLFVEVLPGATHRFNAIGLVDWVRLVLRERQPHQSAAEVEHAPFSRILFQSPNQTPSTLEIGAYDCRFARSTALHAHGTSGTRFTVRYRFQRHPNPFHRNNRESCKSDRNCDRRLQLCSR